MLESSSVILPHNGIGDFNDNRYEPISGVVSADPEMIKICQMVVKISRSPLVALLLGESGTGKEVIARAIHSYSCRHRGPFVAINCAAIPEA